MLPFIVGGLAAGFGLYHLSSFIISCFKSDCKSCGKHTFLQSSECGVCDRQYSWCSECPDPMSKASGKPFTMCKDCNSRCTLESSKVAVVKAPRVGGRKTIAKYSLVRSNEYRDYDDAVEELKHRAMILGGNAIVELDRHKYRNQDGNYLYSTWRASGMAVQTDQRC